MPKGAVEGRDKATTRQRRRSTGALRDILLQPRALKRYRQALDCYFEWLGSNDFALPSSRVDADESLADYV